MSSIDEQKNCTISLAFSQGANSVLSMERNNAVLFSSHRKRGHVLFCRSMYPPSPDKEEKRNRPKADGPLLSIPAANRHGYPTRPHRSSRISIHDPRAGIDLSATHVTAPPLHFNPRPPCGYRPAMEQSIRDAKGISIHDPRAGIDFMVEFAFPNVHENFNPRPPCGDRLPLVQLQTATFHISIHDPRVGIDLSDCAGLPYLHISIHDPRVGIDPLYLHPGPTAGGFQSTTPVWGSTSQSGHPLHF